MSWRVLLGELKQETATFNPAPSRYDDFRVCFGSQMLIDYRGTKTEVAGVMDVLENDGRFEVVPTMAAAAVSGGPIAAGELDRLLDEFVDAVRAKCDRADAACFCLHGAMAGENEGDPEGRVLSAIRTLMGDKPIVVSLDLHAVLTEAMVENADILVPYHTYPHTDQYETGQRAAVNVIRLLEGTVKPTTARVPLPMLVRGDELLTSTGKFGQAIGICRQIEADGGLAAGVIIGNAFTDVPALQSYTLVTTNRDAEGAQRAAERIGQFMWRHREIFQAQLTPLDEAIRQARQTKGLVVFSDAADATASGASGDSNMILKGLLDDGFSKKTLLAIVDKPAVLAALEAGVGAELDVSLGGTKDPGRFTPVTVRARVKSLHDGVFAYEDGTTARAGRAVVLVAGPIHVLVTERSVYVVGRRVFESHGLNPRDFDLVVVKSPNGFRTWYESIADLIVPVDVPGSTSANLRSLPFRHCVRPIFPLDDNVPSPFVERED